MHIQFPRIICNISKILNVNRRYLSDQHTHRRRDGAMKNERVIESVIALRPKKEKGVNVYNKVYKTIMMVALCVSCE